MASIPTPAVPARAKRLLVRLVIPAAVAITIAAAAYAYFSSTGTGSGTVTVGTLTAPVVFPANEPAFNLSGMVGGTTQSRSMTVTVNGALNTRVRIYEQTATGPLLSQLNLKIFEDGSPTPIYNGPLLALGTAGSPFSLPGSAGGLWPAGESHSFVFTVSLPTGVGNAYQNTTGSLSFVWTREQI